MITRTMCWIILGLVIEAVAAPGLSATQRQASRKQVVISSLTCDRGSCRQPLELVNGRSVTIGLTGEGLDALVSGVVTDKSGRRVRGVTVELASPGRPTRRLNATTTRDMTVTAKGLASEASRVSRGTGLELRFTTSAGRTVTAPLDLSVSRARSPTPAMVLKPDLIISRLDVTPTSGPPLTEFVVNVTVKNQGPASLDSSVPGAVFVACGLGLESEFRTTATGVAVENGLAAAVDNLAAGEAQEFTFVVRHLTNPGTREVRCRVSNMHVSNNESDTDNNRRSASFVVTEPR